MGNAKYQVFNQGMKTLLLTVIKCLKLKPQLNLKGNVKHKGICQKGSSHCYKCRKLGTIMRDYIERTKDVKSNEGPKRVQGMVDALT